MTMPGPDLFKECPSCRKPFKQGSLLSAFLAPGPVWTDGRDPTSEFMEYLHVWLRFVKCPACGRLIWIDEASDLGQAVAWGSDRRWPGASYYDIPSEQDYLDALESDSAADPDRVHYLRLRAWWAANDSFREGPRLQPTASLSSRALRNMRHLYDSLSESIEDQRLMKAELARELGLFDEAERLLAFPFSGHYRHVLKVVSDLVGQRQTIVALVRGDEARTPEEIKALEDRRTQRVSRLAALEADLRAAQQAHAQRVAEGKACPKCGFSYAWDGKECGHCHHGRI